MPTISFSGLSSGIDTSGWVDALVSVKQQTVTSLQEQQEAQEALLNVVNEIKSYFSSFQSCLEKLTDSQFGIPSMDLFMQNLAVSSNTNIATATATTEAARQSYDVAVDSLATATKATSGYTQYETKYATLDTQIGLLGAKNGTITVNQQSFSITTEDTIRSLIQKFQNVGVSAAFDGQKGTFTVGVSLSEIDEGATNIKSALKLQDSTVSGAISGSLVYADRDTEFSKLGLTDGKVIIEGVEHTIAQNGNSYTITKSGGTAANLNTVGDFLDYLMSSAVGAESADVDDMGNISIKGATLDSVTGGSNIIDILNLSETFNRTAMESNRLTYIDVHVADLNTKLSDMGINATTTLTVGGNTHNITQDMTLGDVQNLLAAGNVDFDIDDKGVITIDTKGNEISGTLLDVLGLDPSKNGSTITSTAHESHYDADGDTLLSDLGINNSYNYVAYDSEGKALTGNVNNVANKTIDELIADLRNAGLEVEFDDTTHQIVIKDGYIEGTLADALGMSKNTTSYTESATGNTTLEKLGATGNETLTINGGAAKTYGKDTTLETVLNDIKAAGADVTFKDGNVTIQGVTLGGTLPALLGLDATTQGTSVTSGALTVVTDSSASGSDMDATIEHDISLSSKIGDILGTSSNYTLSVDGGTTTTYTKDTTLQTLKNQIEAAGGKFTINDDNTISIEDVTMSGTLVGALGFDSVEDGTRFSTVNPVYIPGATTVANGSTSLDELFGGASGISTFSAAPARMAAPAAAPRAGGYTLSIDGGTEISYANGVTLDDIFADIIAAGGSASIDADGYIVIDGVHLEGTLVDALGLVETSYGTTITSGNLEVTESMTSTSSSVLMGEKEGNLSWSSTVGSITGDDKSYLLGINGTTHSYDTDVTLTDIKNDIVAAGGNMTLNSDNTISITGVAIDGTLAAALGFDVTDYKTTISSNTPIYAKTEDVEADASTTFNDLGINTNLRDYAIYLPDGTVVKASSTTGSSGTATIGDWLNQINNALNTANGTSGKTYAKIEDGIISITGGGYVTGSLPTALGMLTEEVITGTTMVGTPISYIEYEPLKYITSIQNGEGESGKDITYTGSIGNATNQSGTAADAVTSDGLIGPEDEFVDLFGNITDATLDATLSELLTPGASDPLNNDARLPADSYTLKIGSYATKTFDSDTTTLRDVVDYIENLKVYDPTYDMAFDAYLSGNKLVLKTDMDISGTLADVIGLTKVKTEDEYYTYVAKNVQYTALVEGASNGFNFSIVGDKVEYDKTGIGNKDGYEYTGNVISSSETVADSDGFITTPGNVTGGGSGTNTTVTIDPDGFIQTPGNVTGGGSNVSVDSDGFITNPDIHNPPAGGSSGGVITETEYYYQGSTVTYGGTSGSGYAASTKISDIRSSAVGTRWYVMSDNYTGSTTGYVAQSAMFRYIDINANTTIQDVVDFFKGSSGVQSASYSTLTGEMSVTTQNGYQFHVSNVPYTTDVHLPALGTGQATPGGTYKVAFGKTAGTPASTATILTKLSDLGTFITLNNGMGFTVTNNGVDTELSFSSTDTISTVVSKLTNLGLDATFKDGKLRVSSKYSDFEITTNGLPQSTFVNKLFGGSLPSIQTETTTIDPNAITRNTTLGQLGITSGTLSNNGISLVGGSVPERTFTSDNTLGDVFSYLEAGGATVTLNTDGTVSITGNAELSGDLLGQLGITLTSSKKTAVISSLTLTYGEKNLALSDKLSTLGLSGSYTIGTNGTTVLANSTVSNLLAALNGLNTGYVQRPDSGTIGGSSGSGNIQIYGGEYKNVSYDPTTGILEFTITGSGSAAYMPAGTLFSALDQVGRTMATDGSYDTTYQYRLTKPGTNVTTATTLKQIFGDTSTTTHTIEVNGQTGTFSSTDNMGKVINWLNANVGTASLSAGQFSLEYTPTGSTGLLPGNMQGDLGLWISQKSAKGYETETVYNGTLTKASGSTSGAQYVSEVSDFVAGNTYLIKSAADLNKLAELVNNGKDTTNVTFILEQNIDMSSVSNFAGIGNSSNAFKGIFYGNGHIITNLTMSSTGDNVGLFGSAENATIQDVGLATTSITGGSNVGALIGSDFGSLIENVFVMGGKSGSLGINGTNNVAGLIGNAEATTILSSYVAGTLVNANTYVGGIVGNGINLTISNSYAEGISITGDDKVGGFVGRLEGGNISNSFAYGVFAYYDASGAGGGLAGELINSDIDTFYISGGATAGSTSPRICIAGKTINSSFSNVVHQNVGVAFGNQNTVNGVISASRNLLFNQSFMQSKGFTTDKGWVYDGSTPTFGNVTVTSTPATKTYVSTLDDFVAGETYYISTAADLNKLAELVNSGKDTTDVSFILENDIDMSSVSNFAGIGDYPNTFKGKFYGNGHTISNLTSTVNSGDNVGLFGAIDGALIQDLGLKNVKLTGSGTTNSMGALAGRADNSTIKNVFVDEVTVTNGHKYIGGLIGETQNTNIESAYVTDASIEGDDFVGGLVGKVLNYDNTHGITNSYVNNTSVTGISIGGLAGGISGGFVNNSYVANTKIDGIRAGGLAGIIQDTSFDTVYIYNTTGTDPDFGVVTSSNNAGTFNNVIYSKESGTAFGDGSTVSGVTGLNMSAMQDQSVMQGYGFTASNGWAYQPNSIPTLGTVTTSTAPAAKTYVSTLDDFVAGNTYYISTAADLNKLAELVNNGKDTTDVTFILENDIDMSSVSNFAGIGNSSNAFKGNFYGNGHVIKKLTINSSANHVGLFGRTSGATIQDVGLENVNITSTKDVGSDGSTLGALIGLANNNTTIINSYVDGGTINSSAMFTGGLVGNGCDVNIDSSWTNVNIDINSPTSSAGLYVGGLLGKIAGGSINESFSLSNITGEAQYGAGGLVGHFDATITNAYATGNVSSTSTRTDTAVGGLIGRAYGNNSTITNAFYSGSTLSGTNIGGLIGSISSGATTTVSNSAFNSAAASSAVSTGSLSGANALTMDQLKNQSTMQGYGFTTANGWQYTAGTTPHFGNTTATTVGFDMTTSTTIGQLFGDSNNHTLTVQVEGGTAKNITFSSSDTVQTVIDKLAAEGIEAAVTGDHRFKVFDETRWTLSGEVATKLFGGSGNDVYTYTGSKITYDETVTVPGTSGSNGFVESPENIQGSTGSGSTGTGDGFINDPDNVKAGGCFIASTINRSELGAVHVSDVDDFVSGETYLISTAQDLLKLAELTNGTKDINNNGVLDVASTSNVTFILTNDIDMSGYEWLGIGKVLDETVYSDWENGCFKGKFYGKGHIISGLSGALFNATKDALIQDVGIENISFTTGYGNAGIGNRRSALIDTAANTTITNVYATGAVEGGTGFGGLVYYLSGASSALTNSYTDIDMTISRSSYGYSYGGLVSIVSNISQISNSFAAGDIILDGTVESCVGGLIGKLNIGATSQSLSLSNLYSVSNISGSLTGGSVGGIIGNISDNVSTNKISMGTIYYAGDLSATVSDSTGATALVGAKGSIIGSIDDRFSAGNSPSNIFSLIIGVVYTGDVSAVGAATARDGVTRTGDVTLNGITKLSQSEITNQSKMESLGFTTGWKYTAGTTPYLGSMAVSSISPETTKTYVSSLSDSDDFVSGETYYIKTADDLVKLAELTHNGANTENVSFVLENDINMSGIDFEGIGTYDDAFRGNFYGNGHTISNLTMTSSDALDSFGFFNEIEGALIQDVALKNVTITGTSASAVGSLVGGATSSTIINSYVDGTNITALGAIGGLVGYAFDNTSITSSYVNDAVLIATFTGGASEMGGLVGSIDTSTISKSYVSNSNLLGEGSDIGGLVGIAYEVDISDAYVAFTNVASNASGVIGALAGSLNQSTLNRIYVSNSSAVNNADGTLGGAIAHDTGGSTYSNVVYCDNSLLAPADFTQAFGNGSTATGVITITDPDDICRESVMSAYGFTAANGWHYGATGYTIYGPTFGNSTGGSGTSSSGGVKYTGNTVNEAQSIVSVSEGTLISAFNPDAVGHYINVESDSTPVGGAYYPIFQIFDDTTVGELIDYLESCSNGVASVTFDGTSLSVKMKGDYKITQDAPVFLLSSGSTMYIGLQGAVQLFPPEATTSTTLQEITGRYDGETTIAIHNLRFSVNGRDYNLSFSGKSTVQDVLDELNAVDGITASFTNGKLTVESTYSDLSFTPVLITDIASVLFGGSVPTPETIGSSAGKVYVSTVDDFVAGETYYISTAADLQKLASLVKDGKDTTDVTFILEDNIDMTGQTWDSIGTYNSNPYTPGTSTAFKGKFYGNGHTITGLSKSLFDWTVGAKVQDVGLEDIKRGIGSAAGLIRYAEDTIIKNVYVTSDGTISGGEFGGLVYSMNGGSITSSYTDIDVDITDTSFSVYGGLVAYLGGGTNISKSYTTGDISINRFVSNGVLRAGGLVGSISAYTSDGNVNISDVYSTSNFSGTISGNMANVGGLIGMVTAGDSGLNDPVINRAYYSGTMTSLTTAPGNTALTSYIGAVIGGAMDTDGMAYNNPNTNFLKNITNVVYNKNAGASATASDPSAAGMTGLTLDEIQNQTTMQGYGFTSANGWVFNAGQTPNFGNMTGSAGSTTTVTHDATLNTTIGQLVGGDARFMIEHADGSGDGLEFSASDTIQDVIDKLNDNGIMASWNNGKISVEAGEKIKIYHDGHGLDLVSKLFGSSSITFSPVSSISGSYTMDKVTSGTGTTTNTYTMDASTTIGDLFGDSNNHTFTVNGNNITLGPDDTVQDLIDALAGYGVTATINDGKMTIGSNGDSVLTVSGDLANKVLGKTGSGSVSVDYKTEQRTLSLSTTMSELFWDNDSHDFVINKTNGQVKISLSGNDTIQDLITKLQAQGIVATIDSSGKMTFKSNFKWSVSGDLGNKVTEGVMNLTVTPLYTFESEELEVYTGHQTVSEVLDAGGDLITGNRYHIATVDDLKALAEYVNNSGRDLLDIDFILDNDIDMTGVTDFVPIGTQSNYFTGNFYGNGHVISNLKITSSDNGVGLFGYVGDGTIRDLGLEDVDISGNDRVGALVGYVNNATIENVYSTGKVTGAGDQIGGLIGDVNSSNVKNVYSTAEVEGNTNVGGLIGYLGKYSVLENSYATGDVHSKAYQAGGLVGGIRYGGTIRNSYATGDVYGVENVGGLVGLFEGNDGNYTYTLDTVYSTGRVEGTTNVGALIGWRKSNLVTVTNAVYNSDLEMTAVGNGSISRLTGLTYVDMQDAARMQGLGFTTAKGWKYISDKMTPVLNSVSVDNSGRVMSGDKTYVRGLTEFEAGDTYYIGTAEDLVRLAELVNAGEDTTGSVFILDGDINMAGVHFTSIGCLEDNAFRGDFYGNGHEISNLTINNSTTYKTGLFGVLDGAHIQDVAIVNANVEGNGSNSSYVGILAGQATDDVTIENVYVTGSVSNGWDVGGLVGANSATITKSYSTATVSGDGSVGGLVGDNRAGAVIKQSYVTGNVLDGTNAGGFAGFNSGTIESSYATGRVNGSTQVGGFVGYNAATIKNSYATGFVDDGSKKGGFAGNNAGSITGAVYNKSTKLNAVGSGSSSGITGLELSQMWEQDRMEGLGFTADKGWLYTDNTTPFLNTNNTMVNGDKTYVRDAQSFDSGEVFYIGTAQDLVHLAELVKNGAVTTGVTFVLDNDIVMTGVDFDPIGTSLDAFKGVFMGNGHTISGLKASLFGYVEEAIIRDVGLENVNSNYGAALATNIANGKTEIINVYAKGTVTGGTAIGGLIGYINSSATGTIISDSYAEVNITGSLVGGLVGVMNAGTIKNSYASGNVTSTGTYGGGLVGAINNATIENSFASGNVSGRNGYIGGLAGRAANSTITGSYASGTVTGGKGFIASTAGSNTFSGNVYNNAAADTSGAATGLSLDEIKRQSVMEDLGFTSDKGWVYYEDQTPQLRGKDTSKQYTVDASLDSILANLADNSISKDITVEIGGTTHTKHFNDTDTVEDVMNWLNGISGVTAAFDETNSQLTVTTDDGEMNITGGLANTLFGGYTNRVYDKITQNTDSSHLMAAGGDAIITENTTVKQLLNSNNAASIGFIDEDGKVVMESFDPDQTLGEVIDYLNAHGFNASITNGVFTAVKEDGSKTDIIGAIGSALKGENGTTTTTPSGYVSDVLTSVTGEKATGTTQLSALGIDSGTISIQDKNGNIIQNVVINNTMTVNDAAALLANYGITMSITDGKVTVTTEGPLKLVDGSSNMVSQMQLDNWIENKSKLTNTSTVAEMGFAKGAALGVIINGKTTTISFNANDTLDDIITKLNAMGIEASVDADGKFTATSDNGFVLTDELGTYLTQNSVDGYVEFANGYKSDKPLESPGNSTILTEDSLVGDILGTGEGGILRLTLDENTVVDLQYNADDTMQDIMVDLAAYGIQTQIKNGVLTAVNLDRTFTFSGDIGKAISGNTPLYENIETGYISKDLSYETVETANMNSTMKELGILGGQIHILNSEGGIVTTLDVDESFTVSQIKSMLSPYGFNLTMDANGKVSMTSSEGYSVSDGTSNLADVMGLDNWNQTTEKLALDTTISEMGFKDGADLNLFLDGAVMNVLSFDADQTLQDVIFALSAYGIDATVDSNGKFSAVSKEHTFIMSSTLGSFLTKGTSGYVNDDTGYQTVETLEEEKPYTVNSSEQLGYEKLMSADSTLASLGYENGGSVIVNLDGDTYYTLSFLGTDTVQDVIYALSPYGITAEVDANGKFNAVSVDHSFTLTGNVGNFLASGGKYQNEVTGYESDPITFETEEKVSLDTKLSSLGITHGDFNIMKDGKVTGASINITDDTTVGQLFNAIKVYGMEGKIMTDTNGETYIQISADSNTYLADGTANIVSGLGLVEIRQGDFEGNVIYWEDDTDSGLITEDMLLSTLDKDGYIAQGSLIFETGTGDEAVQHIINITADETVGSLIKKFRDAGIDASLSNGVIKISSGLDGITFTGGTSGLVNTIGLDIENVDVYASSSSALTYEGDVHYSAANFANGDTLLDIVNATEGDMSIFVDGVKCTIHVDPTKTFADLFAQISSEVAARTGLNIKAGFLDKEGNIVVNPTDDKNTGIIAFEVDEGHELVVGASNDTTNFATIANLNKTGINQITGSRSLYRVNVNSLITESGLYRDGDITEGTFKIGDAEFTIDSTTTLASLIEDINHSQTAYATAYWDTLSGTMVIQSTLTGASLINIEAGTSNFTDIMGFTTVTDTGASALVTSSQTLGKNAVIRINGTTVTATSNVITSDVSRIKGLTINLKDVSEGETVTITVEQDDEAIFNAVSDTIDAYNAMMEALNKELSDKNTLGNEALLKLMRNNLKRLMTSSLSGAYIFKNLAAIGISTGEAQDSITLDVTNLIIDKDKFMNALDTDSDAVKSLLVGSEKNPGIFLQANNIVESSIKSTGYFSNMIDSLTRNIDRIQDKINKTNDEITKYRDRLERQFHNMELTISGLQNAYSAFLN